MICGNLSTKNHIIYHFNTVILHFITVFSFSTHP